MIPIPTGQRFRLPAWIPGSYLIREFARHFVHVRAEAGGQPVVIDKEAKDLWRAAPCVGPLTVIAHVYAFDLSVRAAYLDATRAYFNGAVVFLCPEGRADRRCEVVARPAGGCGSSRLAGRDDAAAAGRTGVRLRHLQRSDLRRADRPSRRDVRVRARLVRGRRRAPRYRRHGPHPCRPGSRRARSSPRLSVADRSIRRRRGEPRAVRSLPVSDRRRRRGLRRARAPDEHEPSVPARQPARARHRQAGRRVRRLSRSREPRVLPQLEREKDQARGIRAVRSRARELHAPAVGVRRHHVLLRRSRAGAQRRHRAAALPRARRPGDHDDVAHARPQRAKHRAIELRRVDQVLPPGRERAECRRQLLRQGLARRPRARSHAAPLRIVARRGDARAVATLRRVGRRRSGGRDCGDRSRARAAATSANSSHVTSTAPTIRRSRNCCGSSA